MNAPMMTMLCVSIGRTTSYDAYAYVDKCTSNDDNNVRCVSIGLAPSSVNVDQATVPLVASIRLSSSTIIIINHIYVNTIIIIVIIIILISTINNVDSSNITRPHRATAWMWTSVCWTTAMDLARIVVVIGKTISFDFLFFKILIILILILWQRWWLQMLLWESSWNCHWTR